MSHPELNPAEESRRSLYDSLTRWLFGYDVFVSYARQDGQPSAIDLERILDKRGYKVFIDRHAGLAGPLKQTLRRRLARSQSLAILCTDGALRSEHVEFEFDSFVDTHSVRRPVVPVGDPRLRRALEGKRLHELIWVDWTGGTVTEQLVDEVVRPLRATKREVLMRNLVGTIAMVFLVVAGVAAWQWREAARQRDSALALRLAARAELLRDEQADQIEVSALLAVESARRTKSRQHVDELEISRALTRALDLLPARGVEHTAAAPVRLLVGNSDSGYTSIDSSGEARSIGPGGSLNWRHGGAEGVLTLDAASRDSIRGIDASGSVHAIRRDTSIVRASSRGLAGAIISLDGRFALRMADDSTSILIDITTGTRASFLKGLHLGDVSVFVVSPDDEHRYVVLGSWRQRQTFLIERLSHKAVRLDRGNVIDRAVFTQSGGRVALAGRNFEVSAFDSAGNRLAGLRHQSFVTALAFSADGRHLVTGSLDRTARMIDVTSGVEVIRVPHPDSVTAVAIAADNSSFATASGSRIRIFPTEFQRYGVSLPVTLQNISTLNSSGVLTFQASLGDGKVVVADSRQLRSFHVGQTTAETAWQLSNSVAALAADPETEAIVVVDRAGQVLTTRQEALALIGNVADLGDVRAIATRSGWVAVAGSDGARRFAINGSTPVCTLAKGSTWAIALDPSHNRVVLGGDENVQLVDLRTCTRQQIIDRKDPTLSVATSADGRLVAVGSTEERVVLVYDVSGKKPRVVYVLQRQGPIRALAFNSGGDYLAVAAEDRSARVYSTLDGQEVARMVFPFSPMSVGFSSGGSTVHVLTGRDGPKGAELVLASRSLLLDTLVATICARINHDTLSDEQRKKYLDVESGTRTARPCAAR